MLIATARAVSEGTSTNSAWWFALLGALVGGVVGALSAWTLAARQRLRDARADVFRGSFRDLHNAVANRIARTAGDVVVAQDGAVGEMISDLDVDAQIAGGADHRQVSALQKQWDAIGTTAATGDAAATLDAWAALKGTLDAYDKWLRRKLSKRF